MSGNVETNNVLKSDFDLKIQKQHSYLKFMLNILIHIDSAGKYTP